MTLASAPPIQHTSVVISDGQALETLLDIHAIEAPRILDCTYNRGVMWRGVALPESATLYKSDRNRTLLDDGITDNVADFRYLDTCFEPNEFDVIVFDPPHRTEDGHGGGDYSDRYGLASDADSDLNDANISTTFEPFLRSAQAILNPKDGVIFAKLGDQVHRSAQHFHHYEFLKAAEALGYQLCDLLVKVRPAPFVDPKWESVLHARKRHSFWIAVRVGSHC